MSSKRNVTLHNIDTTKHNTAITKHEILQKRSQWVETKSHAILNS